MEILFLVGVCGDSCFLLEYVENPGCFLLGCMEIPGCFLLGCVEFPGCFLLGSVEIPGCFLWGCVEIPVSCWGCGDSWLFPVGERGVSPGPASLPRPEAESSVSWSQHSAPGSAGSPAQEPCLSRVTASDIFSLQTVSMEPSPAVSSGQQHRHRAQFSRGTLLEGTEG